MKQVTTVDELNALKEQSDYLILDCWADWCVPCRGLSPILESLSKEYENTIVFAKCNMEDADDVAVELSIRNLPTLVFYKKGKEVERIVGAFPKNALQEKCNNFIL